MYLTVFYVFYNSTQNNFIEIGINAWSAFEKACTLIAGTASGKIFITDYYKSENMFGKSFRRTTLDSAYMYDN